LISYHNSISQVNQCYTKNHQIFARIETSLLAPCFFWDTLNAMQIFRAIVPAHCSYTKNFNLL